MARGWEDRWMTGDTIARSRRLNGWQIARIGLVVLWVLWAALAWWTEPRRAELQQARADLASGSVARVMFSTEVSGHGFLGPELTIRNTASTESPYLVWRTGDWRVHHADLTTPEDKPELGRLIDAQIARTGAPLVGTPTFGSVEVIALAIVLPSLLILLGGPAPVTGTRWFWFWLGGVPFGLGLLYWLARERPWAQPPPPPLDPRTGRPKRRTGLTGFLVMILSGIVVSILVAALAVTLPSAVAGVLP
jgi:hypothetical protein